MGNRFIILHEELCEESDGIVIDSSFKTTGAILLMSGLSIH